MTGQMDGDDSDRDTISAAELAEKLKVGKNWVWMRAEDLGGEKVEGRWRFGKEAVDRGLDQIVASMTTRRVVRVCQKCGEESEVQRGSLRSRPVVVFEPHLFDCVGVESRAIGEFVNKRAVRRGLGVVEGGKDE